MRRAMRSYRHHAERTGRRLLEWRLSALLRSWAWVRTSCLMICPFHGAILKERKLVAIFARGCARFGRHEVVKAGNEISNSAYQVLAIFITRILLQQARARRRCADRRGLCRPQSGLVRSARARAGGLPGALKVFDVMDSRRAKSSGASLRSMIASNGLAHKLRYLLRAPSMSNLAMEATRALPERFVSARAQGRATHDQLARTSLEHVIFGLDRKHHRIALFGDET